MGRSDSRALIAAIARFQSELRRLSEAPRHEIARVLATLDPTRVNRAAAEVIDPAEAPARAARDRWSVRATEDARIAAADRRARPAPIRGSRARDAAPASVIATPTSVKLVTKPTPVVGNSTPAAIEGSTEAPSTIAALVSAANADAETHEEQQRSHDLRRAERWSARAYRQEAREQRRQWRQEQAQRRRQAAATRAATAAPSAAAANPEPAAADVLRWTRDAIITELASWMLGGTAVNVSFIERYGPAGLVTAARTIFGGFDAALEVAARHVTRLYPNASAAAAR